MLRSAGALCGARPHAVALRIAARRSGTMRSAAAATAAAFVAADRAPARPGDSLASVDTPALLLDLDVFEANCRRLAEAMRAFPGVTVRPHAKAHKCPELAALQLKLLGPLARGVCAQKVSEAEALVAGGVGDVLVSNQVVAPSKMARLAALAASGAKIGVCVDDEGALRGLAAAAAEAGTSIDVLVEINAGQDRCGVETPREAAALAEVAASLAGVRFAGIQAYHGGLQHVRKPADRAAAVAQVSRRAAAAVAAIQAAGLPCGVVTGGGTGTFRDEAGSGVFTEVQPGSFAFGDADYARNTRAGGGGGEWGGAGSQALWVLTQVMSVSPARSAVVVDAGLKAVALDSGPPVPDAAWAVAPPAAATTSSSSRQPSGASAASTGASAAPVQPEYQCGGDEHGVLLYPLPGAVPQLGPPGGFLPPRGTLLRLQPGHCDPTANLYDWIVGYRGAPGTVEGVWRVAARGPGS